MKDRVVLAYSGGLDTSIAIKWLEEKYDLSVVTVTVDVGQQEDLELIATRSRDIGALKHYSIDAKEEFAKSCIFPAIKANALYEGKYPLCTAIARPLIATKLVEIAKAEGAKAVAHGCTGKGNDQVRFDVTIRALNPKLKVIAPVREWNLSRDISLEYARKHGIPVGPKKSLYSIDQNLWGRSVESGPLEREDQEPPNDTLSWTVPIENVPRDPTYIELGFDGGTPKSIDGKNLDPVTLISRINKLAGQYGVGALDHIEDRVIGIKSREVYECPAAITIIEAHRDLEKTVLTKHQLEFKQSVEREWTWLVYAGLWVDPLRIDLEAFIDSTQEPVEGVVKLKFHKGTMKVVGRSSPNSLYELPLATYDKTSTFDQSSALGFIELWSLQSRSAYSKRIKVRKTQIYKPQLKQRSRSRRLANRNSGQRR